jgi:hypothetical protein
MKSMLIGAVCLVGTTCLAHAQAPYQPQPYGQLAQRPPVQPAYTPTPAIPPSWSYDPYTSGLSVCPQHDPRDSISCREQMPPTYGQPDYRTR